MGTCVTIEKCEELTGYSAEAIRVKIKRGVWKESEVWFKAPDGRVLIDMEGYETWVKNESMTVFGKVQSRQSKSTSTTPGNAAKKGSSCSPQPLT